MIAQDPASPPARRLRHPSWLDLRLVAGVLLVLLSVLLGARVVAAADRSVQVWAVARDVSAGTTLTRGDVRPARVRLFDNADAYLRVSQSPAGRTVVRAMHAGELLPRSVVVPTAAGAIVNIPVEPENAPSLARGSLIDVWSTTKGCPPVQVLSRVTVQDVRDAGGRALSVNLASVQVVVRVPPEVARRIIAALGSESTIRVVMLEGDLPPVRAPVAPVERCSQSTVGPPAPPTTQAPSPSATPVTASTPITPTSGSR